MISQPHYNSEIYIRFRSIAMMLISSMQGILIDEFMNE